MANMSNTASSRSHHTVAILLHRMVEVKGQEGPANTESCIGLHPFSERAPVTFIKMTTLLGHRQLVTWSMVKQVRDFVL